MDGFFVNCFGMRLSAADDVDVTIALGIGVKDNLLPVWRPSWPVGLGSSKRGQLFRMRPVAVAHPDLRRSRPVRRESDLLTVRRVSSAHSRACRSDEFHGCTRRCTRRRDLDSPDIRIRTHDGIRQPVALAGNSQAMRNASKQSEPLGCADFDVANFQRLWLSIQAVVPARNTISRPVGGPGRTMINPVVKGESFRLSLRC